MLSLLLLLGACQTTGRDTIGGLRDRRIEIREEKVQDLPEKAMEGYRRFLEETPESALRPEALRRLADLKVEKESGLLSGESAAGQGTAARSLTAPERVVRPDEAPKRSPIPAPAAGGGSETEEAFEKRAAGTRPPVGPPAAGSGLPEAVIPEGTNAREAIRLYTKLLSDYPDYDRTDQVLYQMSRAYEELGRTDEAMEVLARLVKEHPRSRHLDEAQFRRGEYFFTRRRFRDAEEAYGGGGAIGASSSYFPLALYKQGWSRYKQERYDAALDSFIALLDHRAALGVDIAMPADAAEQKRLDDTFRVISLSFSNLGGPGSAAEYFGRRGRREYEHRVYSSLAEFYFEKRRYGDAARTYGAFREQHPFHRLSPQFQMRVIEIHLAGGFPSLVIEAKKEFARRYGVKASYWSHFEQGRRPEVLGWLKENLNDLARHYHARYQRPKQTPDRQADFEEAVRWYREYLAAFPQDPDTPPMNYLLADLYLEHRVFDRAAQEYERTAYDHTRYERSAQAGYAAVYAWRQHLAGVAPEGRPAVIQDIVRSSIRFADAHAKHPKAAIVLGAAADDLFGLRDLATAAFVSHKLIEGFPGADREVMVQALLVFGHSNYELNRYRNAETGYTRLLELLPAGDRRRPALTDNLAAAIYQQGEEAKARGNHLAAAAHFLKVGTAAPGSRIRVNAEYDGAASLIEVKDWLAASTVLKRFRTLFPGHALQPEATRKLASVYREMRSYAAAAEEYERIERESTDPGVRREALLTAAEMHERAGDDGRLLAASRRYAELFPGPAELNLETRSRIAELLKKRGDRAGHEAELGRIVALDAGAGVERTPRTRFLAARAALTLAQGAFSRFAEVRLVEPFEANLARKQELMKAATRQFNGLVAYEIGDIVAAATYYLAETYGHFSRDLKGSERPAGLSALEREEYELAIEEQAYPFEERSIATHQSNLELIPRGVYNEWIEKSLRRLAALLPARYDKPEEASGIITTPDTYTYVAGGSAPLLRPASKDAGPEKNGAAAP